MKRREKKNHAYNCVRSNDGIKHIEYEEWVSAIRVLHAYNIKYTICIVYSNKKQQQQQQITYNRVSNRVQQQQ